MTFSKTQKGAAIAVVLAVLGYFIYEGNRKRWQLFANFGQSDWISGPGGNLAIQLVEGKTNVKAGDTILIEHNNPDVKSGEATVLRIANKPDNGTNWVVLNWAGTDTPDVAGRFKLVKRA